MTQPELEDDKIGSFRRSKKRVLLGIALLTVIMGGIVGALPQDSDLPKPVELLFAIAVAFLMTSWCHYDALERGRRLSGLMRMGLLLAWVIFFPVYAFKTRGLAGFRLIGFALLIGCGMAMLSLLAFLLSGVAAEILSKVLQN